MARIVIHRIALSRKVKSLKYLCPVTLISAGCAARQKPTDGTVKPLGVLRQSRGVTYINQYVIFFTVSQNP